MGASSKNAEFIWCKVSRLVLFCSEEKRMSEVSIFMIRATRLIRKVSRVLDILEFEKRLELEENTSCLVMKTIT